MANGVQLATAYISLNVRTDDIKRQVTSALESLRGEGRKVGSSIGQNIADGMRTHMGGGTSSAMFAPIEVAGVRWAAKAGAAIGSALKLALVSGVTAGIGAAVLGAGMALSAGLARLQTMQQSRIQLSLKLNPQEIQDIQKQISAIVTGTNVTLDEAMAAVPRLVNSKLNTDQIKDYVKTVADASAMTGGLASFGQLDEFFTQVRNKGRLVTDEIENLTTLGLDVRGVLKEGLGYKDDKSLDKALKSKKIGIEQLMGAIQKVGGSVDAGNGKTGLAQLLGTKSLDGSIKAAKASIARIGADFISAIVGKDPGEDPLEVYAEGINKVTDGLRGIEAWITRNRDTIHTVFSKGAEGVGKLWSGVKTVWEWLGKAKDTMGELWDKAQNIGSKIASGFNTAKDALSGFIGKIQEIWTNLKEWVVDKWNMVFGPDSAIGKFMDWLGIGPAQASAATTPANTGPLAPLADTPKGYTRSFGTPSGGYNSKGEWVPEGAGAGGGKGLPAVLPDAHGAHKQIAAALSIAQGMGLQMSAGKDDHDNDGGFHPAGLAGDFSNQKQFGPNTSEMDAFASEMLKLSPYISELIYSGAKQNIKDGKLVPTIDQPGSPYTTDYAGYHGDHVHLAVKDEFQQQFMDALGGAGLSTNPRGAVNTPKADVAVNGPATIQLTGPVDGLTAGANATPGAANLTGRDSVAAKIIAEAKARGLNKEQTVAALATALQETDLAADPHTNDVQNQNGTPGITGLYQQDNSYAKYGDRHNVDVAIKGFIDQYVTRGKGLANDPWQQALAVQVPAAADAGGYDASTLRAGQRDDALDFYNRLAGSGASPALPSQSLTVVPNAAPPPGGGGGDKTWLDKWLDGSWLRDLAQAGNWSDGGKVWGAGTGTSDSIPAWLSNGEHVLTAEEVKMMGGQQAVYAFRNSLKNGGAIRGFAPGGAVDPPDPAKQRELQNRMTQLDNAAELARVKQLEVMQNDEATELQKTQAQLSLGQALRAQNDYATDLPTLLAGGTGPDRSLQNELYNTTDNLTLSDLQLEELKKRQEDGDEIPVSQMMAAQQQNDQARAARYEAILKAQGVGGDGKKPPSFLDNLMANTMGYIPTGGGGEAGTSSLAKMIGMGSSVVNGLIDTGASLANMAVSAAIGAGSMGAAAAAGPAAGFGINMAAGELKTLSSFWLGSVPGIAADALIAQMFPIGGPPRALGYDYTQFAPQLGILQAANTTIQQMGEAGIKKYFAGQSGSPTIPQLGAPQTATGVPHPGAGRQPGPTPIDGSGQKLVGPNDPGYYAPKGDAAIDQGITGFHQPQQPVWPMGGTQLNYPYSGGNGGGGSWAKGGHVGIYDDGGILKPGDIAVNKSKTPEKVLTPQQWEAMSKLAVRGSDGPTVQIGQINGFSPEDVANQIQQKQRLAAMQYSGRPYK